MIRIITNLQFVIDFFILKLNILKGVDKGWLGGTGGLNELVLCSRITKVLTQRNTIEYDWCCVYLGYHHIFQIKRLIALEGKEDRDRGRGWVGRWEGSMHVYFSWYVCQFSTKTRPTIFINDITINIIIILNT